MILFRLISFGIRLVSTFAFVFILQIKFDGKTLEHYLSNMGQEFVGTQVLSQFSKDSVKVIQSLESKAQRQSIHRKLSSEAIPKLEIFSKKIGLSYSMKNKLINKFKDKELSKKNDDQLRR